MGFEEGSAQPSKTWSQLRRNAEKGLDHETTGQQDNETMRPSPVVSGPLSSCPAWRKGKELYEKTNH